MRILIVDDDELLAYLVAEQLHRQDATFQAKPVMTADAARAAVRSAADPFDVFLIDQLLAGSDVDGVALMQELTHLNGSGDTILFTGQDDPATAYKAMEQGAYRYLFKPFDTRELLLILKSLAAFQQIHRERNWLKILAETSIELQKRSTVAEIADATAQCALQLGFERVWFWRVVEDVYDTPMLRGIWQVGYPDVMQPEEVAIPVQGSPDEQKRVIAKGPEIDEERQWGGGRIGKTFSRDLPSLTREMSQSAVGGREHPARGVVARQRGAISQFQPGTAEPAAHLCCPYLGSPVTGLPAGKGGRGSPGAENAGGNWPSDHGEGNV